MARHRIERDQVRGPNHLPEIPGIGHRHIGQPENPRNTLRREKVAPGFHAKVGDRAGSEGQSEEGNLLDEQREGREA